MSLSTIVPVKRGEEFLQRIADASEVIADAVGDISVKELPEYALADAGKVLTVNNDGDGVEWDTPSGGLPAYESTDEGKVLGLAEGSGGVVAPAWVSGGSGGGVKTIDLSQIPARTETIDGHAFDSSTDDLVIKLDGSSETLTAGTYFFTDVDNMQLPFLCLYSFSYSLPIRYFPAVTDTNALAEGFYVTSESPVMYAAITENEGFWFVASDATLAYGESH